MSGEQDRILEQLFQDYQSHRSRMADLAQKMQEIYGTATSPRREVTVTVKHNGGVSDITFSGSAYKRLPPAELSELVLNTINAAREKAVEAAAEVLAPMLPGTMNARDLASGKLGLDAFAPADGPNLPQIVREELQR